MASRNTKAKTSIENKASLVPHKYFVRVTSSVLSHHPSWLNFPECNNITSDQEIEGGWVLDKDQKPKEIVGCFSLIEYKIKELKLKGVEISIMSSVTMKPVTFKYPSKTPAKDVKNALIASAIPKSGYTTCGWAIELLNAKAGVSKEETKFHTQVDAHDNDAVTGMIKETKTMCVEAAKSKFKDTPLGEVHAALKTAHKASKQLLLGK